MTRLASLVAAAAVLAIPVGGNAYYIEARPQADGGAVVPVKYDTTEPVVFRIGSAGMPGGDGSEFDAIEAAFETWATVDCVTISFTRGADEDAPAPMHWTMGGDQGYILVWWSDDPSFWPEPQVGRADWVQDGTGRIIDAEIILNSSDHSWSTTAEAGKLDVQSVVTALIGKAMGITSAMEGNATFPRYMAGDDSKRTLGDDDIAAVQYLYGMGCDPAPADPEAVCTMGRGELADGGVVNPCPPRPETNPGDGGTGGGGTDSGTGGGGTDAGTSGDGGAVDPGDGDGDDGCGCVAAGAPASGSPAWLALGLLGLLAGWRLRRRR